MTGNIELIEISVGCNWSAFSCECRRSVDFLCLILHPIHLYIFSASGLKERIGKKNRIKYLIDRTELACGSSIDKINALFVRIILFATLINQDNCLFKIFVKYRHNDDGIIVFKFS